MAGFLFQWIRGFFKQRRNQNRRRPRQAKPSRRETHLRLENLEERVLFSLNVWLPQRLNPVAGVGQNNQSLQMFQPVGIDLGTETGLSCGTLYTTGSISLVDTGSYNLSVQESGAVMYGGGSFSFSESGTVTFSLSEQGKQGYILSVTSLVLTQTVSFSWSYTQTNSSGVTVSNQSGTDSFGITSLGTGTLDAFFWEGMNWFDPTQKVLSDKNLQMVSMGSAVLTVNETAGTESYTFRVSNGLETISATGSLNSATQMLQMGQDSYSYSNDGSYSYLNQGGDTFTLYEQGSGPSHAYSLNSVAYYETGNPTAGQSRGYGFQFTEAGTITQLGTATQWSNQSSAAHSVSLYDSDNQSSQFTSTLTYSYSEGGAGVSYNLSDVGSYLGCFNMTGEVFTAQGSGSYALAVSNSVAVAGTMTSLDSFNDTQRFGSGANLDSLTGISTDSAQGCFTSSTSMSYQESAAASFTLTEQGKYNQGAFNLGTVNLSVTGAGSFSYSQTDSYSATMTGTTTDTGNGSYNYGEGALTSGIFNSGANIDNSQISGTYTLRSNTNDTLTQSGAMSFALSETGSLNTSGLTNLSSSTQSSSQAGTYSLSTFSSATQTGTQLSVETGSDMGNVSSTYGGVNGASVGNDSFASTTSLNYSTSSSSTSSDNGSYSASTYQAGAYSGSSYALTSVTYGQSASDNWSVSGSDTSSYSGTTSATASGNNQNAGTTTLGGNSEYDLNSGTYAQTSTSTFSSTAADTYSQSGNSSYAMTQSGSYSGGTYSFSSLLLTSSGAETDTYNSSGADTQSTTGTNSYSMNATQSSTTSLTAANGPGLLFLERL